MLIDGEKWACEACVRGHRVSSCHHSDRPLTHINKKGRPVSQCTHCRGLRKSRTTHVKCDCGEKKKKSELFDCHSGEKRDLKQDALHRCGCNHGQRCTCALKKESHLDTVPETGLPLSQLSGPAKPHLTSTKSESTLTIFRDGHHKPPHKHNDMAHKCGLPYTIPRSHTIHHPSDVPRRSADHLPLTQSAFVNEPLTLSMDSQPQSQQPSQQGSPHSAPAAGGEEIATTTAPLDQSFLDHYASTSLDHTQDAKPISAPANMDERPLEQIITSVPPPLDVSTFTSFPNTTSNSPITCMAFQDPYQEPYFASPDSDLPLGSAGLGAPSVDWSSFPLYSSDVPAATSTQTPSYASFDYNSYPTGLPPPSSSGEISEADEFGPLPGLGHAGNGGDMHDLHSVSEASDMDHLRVSSASSLAGLPQAQLLSSNDLESINIDDFLKSANESTAALEHQLHASMAMEPKSVPAQDMYAVSSQSPSYNNKPLSNSIPSPPDSAPLWSSNLFDAGSTPPMDEGYFRQSWAQ